MTNTSKAGGWLLFFYSVPSRPVSSRMKIWRRLSKAGAVQIKGAVYVLPMRDEHYELFQWLVSEVVSLGGEAAFTRVDSIDSMPDQEIRDIFSLHKEAEYQEIGKAFSDVETRIESIRKGSKSQNAKALSEHLARVSRSYEEAQKTDFFSSKSGLLLRARLRAMDASFRSLSGIPSEAGPVGVAPKKRQDYQGRTWVTRKRPFIDRMASAWLIKRFIDSKATFSLVDEKEIPRLPADRITFDVTNGTFTHTGDLCTFETLVRAFAIKDKAVRKIGEIVHELDIRDDKFHSPEAAGLEQILTGIRRSAKNDSELLEKGMSLFEMLYLSKTGGQHE